MNPEKCHVIILGDTIPEDFVIQIDNVSTAPESEVTLLGITLDSKLDFNSHLSRSILGIRHIGRPHSRELLHN